MDSAIKNLEFWMTNLPEKLRSLPIIYLAIPGSHDSTTYAITKKSKMSPDCRVQNIKWLGPVLQPLLCKWSLTQYLNITQQLNQGIRYFDLRFATKAQSDDLYFVHNLYSESINVAFKHLKDFIDTHPKEIIILDCQHFFNFDQNAHQRLKSLISFTFDHKLLPYSNSMAHITLKYMTDENHYQVIVIYRTDGAKFGKSLWPSDCFPTPWPNTVSVRQLRLYLDDKLKKRNCDVAFISQCVLTPTVKYVCFHCFSSLKHKCFLPLEKQKYSWLCQQKPGRGGVNIVISDFVEYQDHHFSKEVISLNQKLLDD